jgi:hypothetical protein
MNTARENSFRIIQTNPFLTDKKHRDKISRFEITAEKELKGT